MYFPVTPSQHQPFRLYTMQAGSAKPKIQTSYGHHCELTFFAGRTLSTRDLPVSTTFCTLLEDSLGFFPLCESKGQCLLHYSVQSILTLSLRFESAPYSSSNLTIPSCPPSQAKNRALHCLNYIFMVDKRVQSKVFTVLLQLDSPTQRLVLIQGERLLHFQDLSQQPR